MKVFIYTHLTSLYSSFIVLLPIQKIPHFLNFFDNCRLVFFIHFIATIFLNNYLPYKLITLFLLTFRNYLLKIIKISQVVKIHIFLFLIKFLPSHISQIQLISSHPVIVFTSCVCAPLPQEAILKMITQWPLRLLEDSCREK